jgi:rod shape-determining protein MreC
MATSRDDFIIAVRSAFLNKGNQQRFSILGLIFFSLILLLLGTFNFKVVDYLKISIKEVVYRSSFIVSLPENIMKNNYIKVINHFKFYDEYKKNELELKKLRSKSLSNEFIVLENKRLKNIIDDYVIKSNEIMAKILIDKQSPFLRSVIANRGSKDNIKLGMVALDGDYLVGKIVEVNYLTSRILLLSDLNSKIPVLVEPDGIQAILSGTGEEDGVIQYFKKNYKLSDDLIVYTSGAGDLFQAGVPVGRIEDLSFNNERKVSFFSDFSQLQFVKIASYTKIKFDAARKSKELELEKVKSEKLAEQAEELTIKKQKN